MGLFNNWKTEDANINKERLAALVAGLDDTPETEEVIVAQGDSNGR